MAPLSIRQLLVALDDVHLSVHMSSFLLILVYIYSYIQKILFQSHSSRLSLLSKDMNPRPGTFVSHFLEHILIDLFEL